MADTDSHTYDSIIVGGGIHGVMLSLELIRHGLRPLLLERGQLGGATTANSSSIVHGGLRYLQQLDITRTRRSFREQRWFLQTFPEHVAPLPCLMPLYGDGLRRPTIFRAALTAYDLLTRTGTHDGDTHCHLPHGAVLSPDIVKQHFPQVDTSHLRGGAVWHDARVHHMPDLIADVAQWAHEHGAVIRENVEVSHLYKSGGTVTGVRAMDRRTDNECDFSAPIVFNTAGPWCRAVTKGFGDERPELFTPVLGWNVLVDREPLGDYAIALQAKSGNRDALFFQSWDHRLHIGTRYAPWSGSLDDPRPTPELLQAFLDEINATVPHLHLSTQDIMHTYAGVLPASPVDPAQPAKRPLLIDHGASGGPRGLYSFSGVKFTTARYEAEHIVRRAFPRAVARPYTTLLRTPSPAPSRRATHSTEGIPIA